MWEDVAGRTGSIKLVDGLRRNIGFFPANSAGAKKIWNSDRSYDAWLISKKVPQAQERRASLPTGRQAQWVVRRDDRALAG
jgi:accessory colonization factor AcfC